MRTLKSDTLLFMISTAGNKQNTNSQSMEASQVVWRTNIPGQTHTGLPKVRPPKMSGCQARIQSFALRTSCPGSCPLLEPCLGDTPVLIFRSCVHLWEVQGPVRFFFFFLFQVKDVFWLLDSALWRGKGERKGKKDFHLIVQQLENCCHLFCLPFAENGKKMWKIWGNKSQYPHRTSLPSLSGRCIPACLLRAQFHLTPRFSPCFSSGHWGCRGFGTGAGLGYPGTGLGWTGTRLRWAGLCWDWAGLDCVG